MQSPHDSLDIMKKLMSSPADCLESVTNLITFDGGSKASSIADSVIK